MESVCTFRLGLNFLIQSISNTEQSKNNFFTLPNKQSSSKAATVRKARKVALKQKKLILQTPTFIEMHFLLCRVH